MAQLAIAWDSSIVLNLNHYLLHRLATFHLPSISDFFSWKDQFLLLFEHFFVIISCLLILHCVKLFLSWNLERWCFPCLSQVRYWDFKNFQVRSWILKGSPMSSHCIDEFAINDTFEVDEDRHYFRVDAMGMVDRID